LEGNSAQRKKGGAGERRRETGKEKVNGKKRELEGRGERINRGVEESAGGVMRGK